MAEDKNWFEMIVTAYTPARPTFVSMIRHGRLCSTIPGVIEPPEITAVLMLDKHTGPKEMNAMVCELGGQRVRVTFEVVEGGGDEAWLTTKQRKQSRLSEQ